MIRIRVMTAADLPLAQRLSQQAGWNQTEADWRRFLDLQADGCFVAEANEVPVGTTTTITFGDVAWIAMVLVDAQLRGRGIGTALMRHALEVLERRGIRTIRLDATPMGLPVYERLGFVEQFRLARYEGVLPAAADGADCDVAPAEQWNALAALDEAVTGADRRSMLLRLFAEEPGSVYVVRHGDGFMASRAGRQAVQLGPCIASPEAGPLLFAAAWRCYSERRVFLDVPVGNAAATRTAEAQGLTVQRYLTRMCRGVPRCERIEWLWASSGPEKG